MYKVITAVLLMVVTATTSLAAEWKTVQVVGGEVRAVTTTAIAGAHTPDPAKNEYPTDYVFPVEDVMYWKKVGNDWVAMNLAEQAVVNESKKQKALVDAQANVDMDALFQAVADAVKNSLKTKAEVEQAFKAGVDPKKQKDTADKMSNK